MAALAKFSKPPLEVRAMRVIHNIALEHNLRTSTCCPIPLGLLPHETIEHILQYVTSNARSLRMADNMAAIASLRPNQVLVYEYTRIVEYRLQIRIRSQLVSDPLQSVQLLNKIEGTKYPYCFDIQLHGSASCTVWSDLREGMIAKENANTGRAEQFHLISIVRHEKNIIR